jgi:2-phosphoglycerate kinase
MQSGKKYYIYQVYKRHKGRILILIGLPSLVGKSRVQSFHNKKDKVWNRLNN